MRSSCGCRSARSRPPMRARPEGSESKLSTYRDGWRILKTIVTLYRIERPVLFYGSDRRAAAGRRDPARRSRWCITYLDTGLVPRFPTAILVTGMIDHRRAVLLRRADPRHGYPRAARDAAAGLSRTCPRRESCRRNTSLVRDCVRLCDDTAFRCPAPWLRLPCNRSMTASTKGDS